VSVVETQFEVGSGNVDEYASSMRFLKTVRFEKTPVVATT
jgi:hypothetical protein